MALQSYSNHYSKILRASYSTKTSFRHRKFYDPQVVESKWQKLWQESPGVLDNSLPEDKSKYYVLSMFPYPSGKLHMGHVRVYTISDTLAHYNRMKGKKVVHPMGWDSFGLPAENAAIDKGINPSEWTNQNIELMRQQLLSLGCQFDWTREISTCSPEYYRWTQWLFLQLYKHGLAYKKKALVNWDPVDQTVLANEQVDSLGKSWRSGAKVEKKELSQWFIRTSDYAEELLDGLNEVDWSDHVKELQRLWIGKSQGAYFDFKVQELDNHSLKVFTTRPDTIYGVSFVAVSIEHDICKQLSSQDTGVRQELDSIRVSPGSRKRFNRGVRLNLSVIHPFTGKTLPVFAADYVCDHYGTQAVMGVPAHDDRDMEFATNMNLPVINVLEDNILIDSDMFSGLSIEEGSQAIIDYASSRGIGGEMTQYKLQDWLISRQRYWGTPIPILYCDQCGMVPVPEDQLPVVLPREEVQLSGRGPSPLSKCHSWLNASCAKPGCCARREMDTIDTFVDSSWYFLRYINPKDSTRPFTEDVLSWMPVDMYIGGIEHATLHLLYARFIAHFLCKIGLVRTREPFQKLLSQGMVEGQTFKVKSSGHYLTKEEQASLDKFPEEVEVNWEKMSKSKHNGVDPGEVITKYGADAIRIYILFKAPPEMSIKWDLQAITGMSRWLLRVWSLCHGHINSTTQKAKVQWPDQMKRKMLSEKHETIQKVTTSLDKNIYNVALASLMSFSNILRDFEDFQGTSEYHDCLCTLCILLAPMAPHITSELWQDLGAIAYHFDLHVPKDMVLQQNWPRWNKDFIMEKISDLKILVDGKGKGIFPTSFKISEVENSSLQTKAIQYAVQQEFISNSSCVEKVIVVPKGNFVNIVTK